jgi:hypothetical protein
MKQIVELSKGPEKQGWFYVDKLGAFRYNI